MSAHLKQFIGKTVSVLTGQINRSFTEEQWFDYFVGDVMAVDERGVLLAHPVTGKLSFFYHQNVTALVEETKLDPDDPEHQKLIEKFKKEHEEKAKAVAETKAKIAQDQSGPPPAKPPQADYQEGVVNGSPFMDINSLTSLAKRAKEGMKKK
jgi:hypothetical protein